MLQVKLTENYTGVTISGDYYDLDHLYDSIYYLIKGDAKSAGEEAMQNHLYGFLYEVRHAYQGQREFELIDNRLVEFSRENFKIKKKDVTDQNVYFSFNYLLTDILTDIVLLTHFKRKVLRKENDIFNPHLNMVNYFYSIVINSLSELLSETKFNKVKNGFLDVVMSDNFYVSQWFEMITVEYANMTKEERQKGITKTLDAIYNYDQYVDYCKMKLDVEKEAKENNCSVYNLHVDNFPEELKW